ncbi:MAG: hypothetical protein K0S28_1940 [Paucimonas sp.]|jgi:hypothetical protein|nr:hypothetical protein [Paucimonas sp.]
MESQMTTARAPDSRYKRTVERIAAEAYWLKTYQDAMAGMVGVEAIGLDFFRVALNAMKDARLSRLIRVLEDDSQTASFWYLLKCNTPQVDRASKKAKLDLVELKAVAASLKGIRDKTFVHIDKDGVFEPQALYKAAGLTYEQIDRIIRSLWGTMNNLHMEVFGQAVQGDAYDSSDIKAFAKLRDDALLCRQKTSNY